MGCANSMPVSVRDEIIEIEHELNKINVRKNYDKANSNFRQQNINILDTKMKIK